MKLVFLDMDGTLLMDGCFTSESAKILDELVAKGKTFCIASGRILQRLNEAGVFNGREGYFIMENGCIVGHAKDSDMCTFKEWENKMSIHQNEMRSFAKSLSNQTDVLQKEYMFSVSSEQDVAIPSSFPNMTVTRNGDDLDFFPKQAGKKNAAVFLMKKLGIDERDIVFVGDSFNDYDLLEYAHNCGTTSNADPEIKSLVLSKKGIISGFAQTRGLRDVLSRLDLI